MRSGIYFSGSHFSCIYICIYIYIFHLPNRLTESTTRDTHTYVWVDNENTHVHTHMYIHIQINKLFGVHIYMCIYKDGCCRPKERIRIYFKISRSTKRFVFFKFIYFVLTYRLYICMFQLVAFVWEHVWNKAFLMGYSMRLEFTLVSSINDLWRVKLVYIGAVVPLSCGVFTLVCFTRLWYLIW